MTLNDYFGAKETTMMVFHGRTGRLLCESTFPGSLVFCAVSPDPDWILVCETPQNHLRIYQWSRFALDSKLKAGRTKH